MTDVAAMLTAVAGRKVRVVVAGDVMLDRYWLGTADRLSPEAPVPVVHLQERRAVLGGAANVAANVAALGAEVTLVGAIGADEAGREITSLIAEAGIVNRLVEAPRPTTVKTRVMAQGQQITRVDDEVDHLLESVYHRAYENALLRSVAEAQAVIIQDYDKGALSAETLTEVLAAARAWRIPVIVDPKSRSYSLYRGASLLKPNWKEFHTAYDLQVRPHLEAAGTAIPDLIEGRMGQGLTHWGVSGILVTRGVGGMIMGYRVPGGQKFEAIAGRRVAVADISGAGDTVAAWVGTLAAANVPLVTAARLANVAASVQVAKAGTAVVYPQEVLAVIQPGEL